MLQEQGYEYKAGKYPAVRGKGQKRFVRFCSLGENYSPEVLSVVIAGEKLHAPKKPKRKRTRAGSRQNHQTPQLSFLIDIQQKMQEGKGGGYSRWAKVYNLKQMAKAMLFMEEHGISNYKELKQKADTIAEKREQMNDSMRADEARLQEIAILKTHKINYLKAKDIFQAYRASGYSKKYFEEHRDVLTLRKAAKEAFDQYMNDHPELEQLPTVKELNAEYSEVLERKKRTYSEFRKVREEAKEWAVAESIVRMLQEDGREVQREEIQQEQDQKR